MKTYYYGHSLYTRGKPLKTHVDWLRKYGYLVMSLSPAYPEHLAALGANSIHIPLPDGLLTPEVIDDVMRAKNLVVERAVKHRPVLTHCNAGRNRAALVTALAYADLAKVSGEAATVHVKQIRTNALANEHFVTFLAKYEPQPVP